ncbi:hypothetical protein, partial [Rhizobium sp. LjRoot30]|uniref:hypothetical protein n=1 Tax=Rhizobium sp. LjRoot30 TaxID=3342320 RepID=UPI003F4F4F21
MTSDMYPGWVEKFKQFYLQFPKLVQNYYSDSVSCRKDGLTIETAPKLWKLVGDEIVFCCRLHSLQHLSCCVNAFLDAMAYYGQTLEEDASTAALDIKGAGWVACSPPHTVTLRIDGGDIRSTELNVDFVTEGFELEADNSPAKFDFIDTAIDAGFRCSEYAAADRFSPSAELVYLLAVSGERHLFTRPFTYHGRQLLKGVHGNTPYPSFSLDCERDPLKRELRTRERALTQEMSIAPLHVREFIVTYLQMV